MATEREEKKFVLRCANKNCPGKEFTRPFAYETPVVTRKPEGLKGAGKQEEPHKETVHIQCPHCGKDLFATIDMVKPDNTEFDTFLDSAVDVARHKDWITYQDKQRQEFADKINTQANTFNTIFTGVFGIYTMVLFFFGLSTASTNGALVMKNGFSSLLFLIPIVCWLIGAAALLLVTRPGIGKVLPESTESYVNALDEGNKTKANWFIIGMVAFAAGLVFIVVPIVVSLASAAPAVPLENNVQFIVNEDGALALREIPIQFESDNKTVPMLLVNTTDSYYEVRLANNDTFNLDKEWVEVMIHKAGNETTTGFKPGMCPGNQSVIGINETGYIMCGPCQG
jgi:hypothetical protein